ncbi:gamma-glutamyltransferase family protein [Thermosulfuriphilus sp.]
MKGAIACGNSHTARAAEEILARGGNAFDALVAAAFASGVAEAALTSLGGGGFALVHLASKGQTLVYDFFVNTPGRGAKGRKPQDFQKVTVHFAASSQDFNIGLASVAVPGTLKGLLKIHQDLGSLPLEMVLAPAIHFARNGFVVDAFQAYCFSILEPIIKATAEMAAIFCPQGRPPKAGEILQNPELADFLESLPEGLDSFYQGEIALALESMMEKGGGLLTREDLSSYEVICRKPLRFEFSQGLLLTNPPPAFGGGMVALSLKLFEEFFSGGEFLSEGHLRALVQSLYEAHVLRETSIKDQPEVILGLLQAPKASRGTTHISVADGQGNLAALTMTFGEASGYLAPGTGIVLNNIMGEDDLHPRGFFVDPPGTRVSSMMAPSLLISKGVKSALGSGGSKRIRSAIFEVIANLTYFGLEPARAVSAPRAHFDGEILQAEPGIPQRILEKFPWPFNLWPVKDLYFGGVHLVNSRLEGAADERRAGVFKTVA